MRCVKKKVYVILLIIIISIYCIFGNPVVQYNNYRLNQSVRKISETEVVLNEVVPFQWDTVYTFTPYTSREEIEEIIGFKSNAIKETVNEGMVQLVFVREDAVVCSICGYADSLGYLIDFDDKVEFEDNTVFEIDVQDEIVCLKKR